MAKPLTDSILALTRYANETTGQSDPDLSSAVRTLCDGYGGGGYTVNEVVERAYTGDMVYTGTMQNLPSYALAGSGITSFESSSILQFGGNNAFSGCHSLERVSLPNCVANNESRGSLFSTCTSLTDVNLPKVQHFGQYCFDGCSALEVIALPSLARLQNYTFRNCSRLKKADVGKSDRTNSNTFNGCTVLTDLIIRRTSGVCALTNINAFTNTPFASGGTGGTLYVPQDLISSYQSASGWSTILGYANNSIQAIEGSQYENYYADGTAIE